MKWQDTVSSQCRWSEYAQEMFYNWDILWEQSINDYQGDVNFVAYREGKFAYMHYSYGSCSGCDPWEEMSEEDRRRDFATNCVELFDDVMDFKAWINIRDNDGLKEAMKEHQRLFNEQFIKEFENVH